MPTKPRSHSQRQHAKTKAQTDKAYDANQRKQGALKEAKDIRSSARWQKVRAIQLSHSPLCADPFLLHRGRSLAAVQVDHIIPLGEAPGLAFELSNLQSLCTVCHAYKSQGERRGV